jgi:hypothetical protein
VPVPTLTFHTEKREVLSMKRRSTAGRTARTLLGALLLVVGLLVLGGCASRGSEGVTLGNTSTTAGSLEAIPPAGASGDGAVAGTTSSGGSGEASATTDTLSAGTGSAEKSVPPGDVSVGSMTRVTEAFADTGTTVPGRVIRGLVMGKDDKPVSGASVQVLIDAGDPLYESSGGRLIGTATTGTSGTYEVSMSALPLGSIVDVSVVKSGYTSVLVYGTYDQTVTEVDFINFGSAGGDRRMPTGDQIPPLPYEGLLPGEGGS